MNGSSFLIDLLYKMKMLVIRELNCFPIFTSYARAERYPKSVVALAMQEVLNTIKKKKLNMGIDSKTTTQKCWILFFGGHK